MFEITSYHCSSFLNKNCILSLVYAVDDADDEQFNELKLVDEEIRNGEAFVFVFENTEIEALVDFP